jgi:hypothetical protein
MSRSYRKPINKDGYGTKRRRLEKSIANRVIRKAEHIPDGKAYRKWYDSWNICDWRSRDWTPPIRSVVCHRAGIMRLYSLEELLRRYHKKMRK